MVPPPLFGKDCPVILINALFKMIFRIENIPYFAQMGKGSANFRPLIPKTNDFI